MPTKYGYDGHNQLSGVFGGNAQSVPTGYAQQAVNRFFREDFNRTRPSIRNIVLEFENDAERVWFQGANGQGATFYNSYPSFVTPVLVASIGGRIYTIDVQGTTGIVKRLFDGNSAQFTHAWFGQGFEWLVIQDGIHAPIFWNGKDAARRSDLAQQEMPIGSVMAFIHGRFVVASSDGKNSIFVGDIAYGSNVTKPVDILSFTEQTYWAEGGSFDTPVFVGDIMVLYAMPFLDTGTGQNELVVGCTQGFTSLDLSRPRPTWVDTQVQKVALIGDGLVSSHGFAGLNGDMFFRSAKGINTYRNARIEYSQRWNQTPISREVNYWIKPDRKDFLEYVPMVTWQNMCITGCSPLIARPNNPYFGFHRYCRGMVVFDADAMSTAGRDGTPVWHGMWSGVRPWAFAQGMIGNANRCFAFSYDRDGRNRLYEFTLTNGDDVYGTERRKVQGFYTTGMFGSVPDVTSPFAPKVINGGCLEFSEVQNASAFTIEYRPDGSPCWVPVDRGEPGCDCPTRQTCEEAPNRSLTAYPQWGRKYFQQVNPNGCVPGSTQPAGTFHHCQVKVGVIGSLTVDRLNIRFEPKPDAQIAECLGNTCDPIDCCPNEGDYAYHIAPAGTNDEVPVTPGPPGPKVYLSTRTFKASCPGFPSVFVIAQGQAQSIISQQDADTKAQAAAVSNANEQLKCPACHTSTPDDFFIDGGNEDLSGFFSSGLFAGMQGQPWRLRDVIVDEDIANGIVNDDGTLTWAANFPSYTHGTFDENTNIYTDNGGGSTRIQVQIGCNIGGTPTWPEVHSYGV
jgi:hypothetical protein